MARTLALAVLSALSLAAFDLRAAAFKLNPAFEGEQRRDNKIWTQYQSKKGTVCGPRATVCDANGKCLKGTAKGAACGPACVVEYLNVGNRNKLKLTWDKRTSRWLGSDKRPYDTAAEQKRLGVHDLFSKNDRATAERWHALPAIWVLDLQGSLHVSVAQRSGRFNHASILAGAPVLCAGQVRINQGVVTHINNQSGHYLPEDQSFAAVVAGGALHLRRDGTVEYCGARTCGKKPSDNVSPTKIQHDDAVEGYLEED